MKKRIGIFAFTLLCLVLLNIISVCSATAITDYTEEWYMNSSAMYGYSTLGAKKISSGTYCDNVNYQKRVEMRYRLYTSDGSIVSREVDNGYITNSSTNYAVQKTEADFGEDFFEVTGVHWVKAATHMYWCSDDCDDNSYVIR